MPRVFLLHAGPDQRHLLGGALGALQARTPRVSAPPLFQGSAGVRPDGSDGQPLTRAADCFVRCRHQYIAAQWAFYKGAHSYPAPRSPLALHHPPAVQANRGP